MEETQTYYPLGIMSGSSLDGLDMAYCKIEFVKDKFHFEILKSETTPFSELWVNRLKNLPDQSALVYAKTNTYFSYYIGDIISSFILKHNIDPDFLSFHGHTIFHLPNQMMTAQIGNGGALASQTGYPVICDFRTTDIGLRGEGTPLAPIADKLLFSEYDFCLNIGGIANITQVSNEVALDISPANQILNYLANELGFDYDDKGKIARSGRFNEGLYAALNEFDYYKIEKQKSLDNNQIRKYFFPILTSYNCPIEDKLYTCVEHISDKICDYIRKTEVMNPKVLCTGGGSLNDFLIEKLTSNLLDVKADFVVPSKKLINFKESLLMALMGVLRLQNSFNTLSSVTGARKNTVGGAIYQGTNKYI